MDIGKMTHPAKKLSIVFLSISWITAFGISQGLAQVAKSIANPGAKGIYILLGHDIPFQKITSYQLGRRAYGKTTWVNLATVTGPESKALFSRQLTAAHRILTDLPEPNSAYSEEIWRKARKDALLDSIPYWGTLPTIRMALGTMYLDTTAQSRMRYEYRVTAMDRNHKTISTVISKPVSYPKTPEFAPIHTYKTQSSTRQNFIQWNAQKVEGSDPTLFRVFRQTGLHGPFQQIHPRAGFFSKPDTLFLAAMDTLVQPMQIYRYYALPIDLYGNTGSTSDTTLVGTYNFRAVLTPQQFHVQSSDSMGGLLLTWRLKDPGIITALSIFRSTSYDTGYVHLADIPPTDPYYIDQDVVPMQKYFYYMVLNGPLGEVSAPTVRAFSFFQHTQPSFPPRHITGVSVYRGVKLQWTTAQSDIDGYRVYRSSGRENIMIPISTLLPAADSVNTFIDSTNTLSGEITYAYAVRSENLSHQQSAFSDTVYVNPGSSKFPPVPMNLHGYGGDNYVQLYWTDMQSFDEALSGYQILRRTIIPSKHTLFKTLIDSLIPAEQNHFADSTAQAGKSYEYKILSQNIFGKKSRDSSPLLIKIPLSHPVPPAGVFISQSGKAIVIRWTPAIQKGIKGYRIYRYQRGEQAKRIGSITIGNPLEIKDSSVKTGELYFYYCTSVNGSGIESQPSRETSIRPGV